jgi:hypothetical protein
MQTFTLLPQHWWIVRAFRRNPLVRLSDRVGVLLVLLACVASIIAAPVAGAVGTAVYDAHSLRHAEQAQTRHPGDVVQRHGAVLDNRRGDREGEAFAAVVDQAAALCPSKPIGANAAN